MMKLLLGGTSDSTAILEVLDRLKINVTSSVVTDYGRHLASKFGQPVIQGRLTAEDMVAFVKENDDSFVKVQESVRWGDYKKTLNEMKDGRVATSDGQIIEGMTVTQDAPSFYVEVAK